MYILLHDIRRYKVEDEISVREKEVVYLILLQLLCVNCGY